MYAPKILMKPTSSLQGGNNNAIVVSDDDGYGLCVLSIGRGVGLEESHINGYLYSNQAAMDFKV